MRTVQASLVREMVEQAPGQPVRVPASGGYSECRRGADRRVTKFLGEYLWVCLATKGRTGDDGGL